MDTDSFQKNGNLGRFEVVFDPNQDHIQVSHTFVDSLSLDFSDDYLILIDPKGNCFHLNLDVGSNRTRYINGVGKMFQFYGIFHPHKIELTYKGSRVFDYKIFNHLMLEFEYPDLLRRSVIVLDSDSDDESESNGWKVIMT